MAARTDTFDLGAMRLASGEGRHLTLSVTLDDLEFAGQLYEVMPSPIEVSLDVSRMTHAGYALRLRFEAALRGPCMRCLEDATPSTSVDVREVDQPGGGDELSSPYVTDELLDLAGWARDAYALALPAQVVCRPDCAGLCAECGENLNTAGPEHHHDAPPDPRWSKLRELKLD